MLLRLLFKVTSTILGASKETCDAIVFSRVGSKHGGALQDLIQYGVVLCCVLKHPNVLKDIMADKQAHTT